MATTSIATTCTRDCPNTCGLIADVEDGHVIRLYGNPEHPLNEGRTCSKCQRYLDRVYHPHRMLFPLRKVQGDFRRITWHSALDEMAARIKDTCAKSGPESILYYQGFGARTALKLVNRRFFNHLGPVSFLKGTVCGGTGQAAQDMDFGERISHDFRDCANSGSMVLWGRNPAVTNINILSSMKAVHRRGGTVALIDPLETKTAGLCDVVLTPRPGADAWLALALAQLVFNAGAADEGFLVSHCDNCQAYKKLVYEYDINTLAERCDVPLAAIEKLADILIKQRPVAFLLGWGLHRWQYAHTAIRAIDALAAACGSIGVPGGGCSQGFEEYLPYDWSVWGDEMNPGSRRLLMPKLAEELERADPPIEMMVVSAGNPLAMLPDSNAVRRAFERIPFKVVIGHFLDDTAQTADLFLPATTFLEENDVVASYGHSYVGPVRQVVEPPGQARSDFQIFMELGSRFPFASEYVKSAEDWLDVIMRPTWEMGVSRHALEDGGFFQPDVPSAPHVPYADKRFPTPSGKFQLLDEFEVGELPEAAASESGNVLAEAALPGAGRGDISPDRAVSPKPPLDANCQAASPCTTRRDAASDSSAVLATAPDAPAGSALSAAAAAGLPLPDGTFYLMSTAPFLWLCSESNPNQFKGILPVQVNTAAAKAAGLEHGDLCVVRSAQGELVCQAACSDTQRSDLVCVPRGGWELAGRNVNLLTSAVVSKVGNGAAYYETTVTLHPHSPAQGGAANRRCGDDD